MTKDRDAATPAPIRTRAHKPMAHADRADREPVVRAPEPNERDRNPADSLARHGEQPTARCKDGHLSYSPHHTGACADHGGVADWLDK